MLLTILGILLLLFIMLSLMYAIEYYNINMNPMKEPVKIEEIVVETFVTDEEVQEPYNAEPVDNFCIEYRGDNTRLDQACKTLDKFDDCMGTSCCIWGGQQGLPNIKKNGNCLLGNSTGPIFRGSAFDSSEYYFQNVKYPNDNKFVDIIKT